MTNDATSGSTRQVQAHVLKQVRVFENVKPGYGVLELQPPKGSARFLLTREGMLQVATHLKSQAERITALDVQNAHSIDGES